MQNRKTRLLAEPFYDRDMQGSPDAQNRSLHKVNEDSSIGVTQQIPSKNELCKESADHDIQRCHYYTSLSYTLPLQSGKDHSYDALKPVIMISLLTHKMFTDDVPCVSHHIPLETVTKKCFMDTVSYTFIELPKFNETMAKQDPILAQWIDFFKNAEGPHDMNNIPAPIEIEEAYHTIEKCMWNQGELMEYERFKIASLDNVDALQTAKNDGMKEGESKAKVQMIKELHNDGVPLASIIKASALTKEEVEHILNLPSP